MLESDFLVCDRRASSRQIQIACAVALALFVASLATLPFRHVPLPGSAATIAIVDTALLSISWMIATLLFALGSALRSNALVALGAGYFFAGLFVVLHVLGASGVFTVAGSLDVAFNTTGWFYFIGQAGLSVSIIVYALLHHSPLRLRNPSPAPFTVVPLCIAFSVIVMAALTLLVMRNEQYLPQLASGPNAWSVTRAQYVIFPLIVLTGIAMAVLWRAPRSILNLWLLLTLWARLLEFALIMSSGTRFSVEWYAVRTVGLLSAIFMLVMLIAETSRLYVEAVIQITSKERELENRFMLRDAIGTSIAHELRQPLAALVLNARTGQQLGARDDLELSAILDDIVKDCHRASDIVESTRAAFGNVANKRTLVNCNRLIRETLLLVSRELRANSISVKQVLDAALPGIVVNQLHMQQVFMNLFMNSVDAMSDVANRPRVLTIQSSRGDAGLLIRVEDTGHGIDPALRDRVFDTFFTTKVQGSGMGLSICRAVIASYGGSIRVIAVEPFGTCFEISLPCGENIGAGEVATDSVVFAESNP